MSDANAKLLRLRSKMLDCCEMWGGYAASSCSDGAYWSGRKWVAEYVVQRIDDLLAESEPQPDSVTLLEMSPAVEAYLDELASDIAHARAAVRAAFGVKPCALPRESLAEEVARLHGFVGPDGRGCP